MRKFVALGLLAGLFAGCSADQPSTSTARLSAPANPLAAGIAMQLAGASHRIASLQDRGNFLSYAGGKSVQHGAYTWHPVELSEARALAAMSDGGMVVQAPDGKPIRLKYERAVEHPDGNWTWIGRAEGATGSEAILTFGDKAVFGAIPNGNGPDLEVATYAGRTWMVETDASKLPNARDLTGTSGNDTLMPTGAAAIAALQPNASSAAASALPTSTATVKASASAASAEASPAPVIDLVVGYTPTFASRLGGASQALTRLNSMVDIANQAYENSEVPGRLRLVHAMQVNYPEDTSNRSSLLDLTGVQCTTVGSGELHLPDSDVNCTSATPSASLQPLLQARETYHADLVSLVRPLVVPAAQSCGVGWLIGGGQTPITSASAALGFSVVSDSSGNQFPSNGNTCRSETLAHELGHNMGLAHDRTSAAGSDDTDSDGNPLDPNEYGRYPYSFGYATGTDTGNFYTIMALRTGSQTSVRVFSDPRVSICAGLPCGVASVADNAQALVRTMPIIATFRNKPVPMDFNGDATSDILWRNTTSGANTIWLSANSGTLQGISRVSDVSWQAVGAGDFNGDGKADVLWRNSGSGANSIWYSGNASSGVAITAITSQSWKVAGIGDFNGDGKSDILWRNSSSGANSLWLSGNSATGVKLSYVTDLNWKIVGVGDFNADGKSDIVWRNTSTGADALWFSGNSRTAKNLTGVTNQAWTIAGVGDFDGDGVSDLVWRNVSTGADSLWLSGNSSSGVNLTAVTGAGWYIADVGDYNGDGKSDLLWRNTHTGANGIWLNANSRSTQAITGVTNLQWTIIR